MKNEGGFSVLEVLVAMSILAIVALGLAKQTVVSYKTMLINKRNTYANVLAQKQMEKYSFVPVSDLTTSVNTETIRYKNMTFDQTVDIEVQTDGTADIEVIVETSNRTWGGKAKLLKTVR